MSKYKNAYPMCMDIKSGYPLNHIYMPKNIQVPKEDEDNEASDLQYMKQMYPDTCKRIQAYVDEACDKMAYEGSMMYDQYPDKATIDRIADHICDRVDKEGVCRRFTQEIGAIKEQEEVVEQTNEGIQMQDLGYDWTRDLVKILLLNELFGRRRVHFYNNNRTPYYNEPTNYYPDPYDVYTTSVRSSKKYPNYYRYYFE